MEFQIHIYLHGSKILNKDEIKVKPGRKALIEGKITLKEITEITKENDTLKILGEKI